MLGEKVFLYVYDFDEEVTKIKFNSLEELDNYTMDCQNEKDLKSKLLNNGYLKSNLLYPMVSIMDIGIIRGEHELTIRYSEDLYNYESLFDTCVEFFTNNYMMLKNSPLKKEFANIEINEQIKEKDILQGIRKYFSKKLNYRSKRELYFYLKQNGAKIKTLESLFKEEKDIQEDIKEPILQEKGIDTKEEVQVDIKEEIQEEPSYLEELDSKISNPNIDLEEREKLIEELSGYDLEELNKSKLRNQVDGVREDRKQQKDASYLEFLTNLFNNPEATVEEKERALAELMEMDEEVPTIPTTKRGK